MDASSRRTIRTKDVTLQDIANHCGVCKATVSLALRESPLISPPTTARIHAAAKELGYRPALQNLARRLALRKQGVELINHLIALFLPLYATQANYYYSIFRGIIDVLTPAGFAVVTIDTFQRTSKHDLPHIFRGGEIDGIIAMQAPFIAPLLESLCEDSQLAERPLVSMVLPMPGCSNVMPDVRDGAYQSARHLLELGHRHLLHCVFPEVPGQEPQPTNRLEGARQAMREAGIDPTTHLHIFHIDGCWYSPDLLQANPEGQSPQAREQGARLLAYLCAHPEVTAILSLNDANALNAWYTLEEAGIRVPEEISIIGFDDTDPMPGDRGKNLLTTVHLPLFEVGQHAAKLIMQRITGELPEDEEQVLPVHLAVRHSTAAAR